jgi:hypothetical protein
LKPLKNSLKPRIRQDCTLEKSATENREYFARVVRALKSIELKVKNIVVSNVNIPFMTLLADG